MYAREKCYYYFSHETKGSCYRCYRYYRCYRRPIRIRELDSARQVSETEC